MQISNVSSQNHVTGKWIRVEHNARDGRALNDSGTYTLNSPSCLGYLNSPPTCINSRLCR